MLTSLACSIFQDSKGGKQSLKSKNMILVDSMKLAPLLTDSAGQNYDLFTRLELEHNNLFEHRSRSNGEPVYCPEEVWLYM
jgi:hypothetical protein